MTGSALTLAACADPATWDAFVAASPQGSVFCRTAFLAALDVEVDRWLVSDDGGPRLGAVVLRRGAEVLPAPYPFTLYHGVLLAPDVAAAPPHERFRRVPELLDFTLRELAARYPRLSFCLHHAFEDLRGFQWLHYHEPERGQFRIELRYTGLLDLRAYGDFERYLATIRTTRRQHYHKSLREGLGVEASTDIETLDRLHEQAFERQALRRDRLEVELLRAITTAALKGAFGDLLVCRDERGDALSATLFLHDERCGYWMFAGNDPARRGANGGTLLLLENIRRCYQRGLRWVDTVGINSPRRGDFKTSFNAMPAPYFTTTWERP